MHIHVVKRKKSRFWASDLLQIWPFKRLCGYDMGEWRNSSYGAGQGVGPKNFFIDHMTWSTGCRTSPPPRGGFSQCLPIFAWNMPVFSQAQYSHVGMMGVHPHGSVPHFNQFNVRDWNNGRAHRVPQFYS